MSKRNSHKKEYSIWRGIKNRCLSESCKSYYRYGGRGITISPRWMDSFDDFLYDVGECPGNGYSLDRINNNGNYEPKNVKWSTAKEQQNNTRTNRYVTMNGERLTMKQWCEKSGVSYERVQKRLLAGWSDIDAFAAPRYAIRKYKEFTQKDFMLNTSQLESLINVATLNEDIKEKEKKMLLRYFMYENFGAWMPQRMIAKETGIQSTSTISLQIKKLNTETKYRHLIQKIRGVVKEFNGHKEDAI